MKPFLSTLFFLTTVIVHAQENKTDENQAVQKTVSDFFQALADRNAENLKFYCTPDILILESGAVWNLDTLVQKISRITGNNFKRSNSFEFIETNISGSNAWVTFYNSAEMTWNDKHTSVKWIETAILINEKGQWKIKTLHSTTLKRS